MSDDVTAFLRAICESPDDDTPRLVFADWLDEHGDPDRAEFIRIQCALAGGASDPALRRRERLLLGEYRNRWLAPLPAFYGLRWGTFHRGFVDEVEVIEEDDLLRHLDRVVAAAPVQAVRFRVESVQKLGTLTAHPAMAQVRMLDFRGCRSTPSLRPLARAPALRLQRVLVHDPHDLGPAEREALRQRFGLDVFG